MLPNNYTTGGPEHTYTGYDGVWRCGCGRARTAGEKATPDDGGRTVGPRLEPRLRDAVAGDGGVANGAFVPFCVEEADPPPMPPASPEREDAGGRISCGLLPRTDSGGRGGADAVAAAGDGLHTIPFITLILGGGYNG